ncbi:MAG: hypothetical protein ACOYNC_12620 [Bacteroidales bacterium]
MSDIEKFIRNHRDEFDEAEPAIGHLDRFADRLSTLPLAAAPRRNRSQMLKIAAVIVVLISAGGLLLDFATRGIRERYATGNQGTELPAEIRDAVQYYTNQTNSQVAAIHNLAADHEEALAVNTAALNEIHNLDAITAELKKSLEGNPGNEQILDAIIRNEQMKERMLNTILKQLAQVNKQQN